MDQLEQNLKDVGETVATDGRVYHSDGSGYCKPDICSIGSDGSAVFIEMKTGGADFTTQQKKGIETITDANGNERYRIPPTATVDKELAIALELKPGQKIGDRYPDGIELVQVRRPGLNESKQ